MSLLFFDGFETEKNLDQKWEVHGWNPQYSITVDVVNSGTNALRMVQLRDNYNCIITKKIRPSSTVITGFAIRFEKISANVNSFFYMENKIGESPIPDYGRRSYIQLKFNSSSKIEAYFMGTLIGTGTKTINTNTWYYLENKLEFITSNIFQYTLKIDETTTDIYASRSDFITATDHVDYITFVSASGSETGGPYGMYLDDVYILDGVGLTMNNFLGKCIVLGSRVNEIGTFNDFTSYDGTSSKVDALREIIGDKNTYAYDHSMLSMQSFNLENISNAGNVYGVIVNQNIQKSTPRSETVCFSPFVKNIDGVEHYRDDVTLTDNDWNCYSFAYEVDPFTGVQQSTSSINTTEIGMKIVAEKNINRAQLTQLGVEPISKSYALNVKAHLTQASVNVLSSVKSIKKYSYATQSMVEILSKTKTKIPQVLSSGGIISYWGDYKVHTFISNGDFSISTEIDNTLDYIIIGGGGGGGKAEPNSGGDGAGGGGAGGFLQGSLVIDKSNMQSAVTIGQGGLGSTSNSTKGTNGTDSTFLNYVAIGGGGGGSDNDDATGINRGANGGSGGGAASRYSVTVSGGSGTSEQGNSGGACDDVTTTRGGAGGGGAGGAGGVGSGTSGGAGGTGKSSVIQNGTTQQYSAGGAGGACTSSSGSTGATGSSNTGNGGGGGASIGGSGGNGGSGIVIIKCKYVPVFDPTLIGQKYRKPVSVSRSLGSVVNYPMKVLVGQSSGSSGASVHCNGKCLSNFNDLRFTSGDETTNIGYQIESISGSSPNQTATIWINFNNIGTNPTNFYMYYGNPSASAASDGANTFTFFDDFTAFNDTVQSKSSPGGSITYSNSIVTMDNTNASSYVEMHSINRLITTKPFIIEAKYQRPSVYRNRMYNAAGAGQGSPTAQDYGDFNPLRWNNAQQSNPSNNTQYIVQQIDSNNSYDQRFLNMDYSVFQAFTTSPCANTGYFSISGTENTSSDLKFDQIRARNYQLTEPVIGLWGSEQKCSYNWYTF